MELIENIKDYRSWSESQLNAELKSLEARILEITHDPVDYKHYSPFLDWCGDEKSVEAVQEMMSDRCCILNRLFDFHCTDKEIARLEKVNDLLLSVPKTRTTLCKIPGQGLRAFWAESVFSRQSLPTHYGLDCAGWQIRRAGSAR